MSKGDGRVMRAAAEILKNEHESLLDSSEVARRVFDLPSLKDVTPSQSVSVRRALRRIWERDPEIVQVPRKGKYGRTQWGRLDVYERGRAEAAKVLRGFGFL